MANASPGGRLALTLAWLGGALLFCSGLLSILHGLDVPVAGLVLATGWGAVAVALGLGMRVPRGAAFRWFGSFWLLVALGAWGWLWWSQNG